MAPVLFFFFFFPLDDFLKPQIRTHPETTVALRGMNVTLTCTAVSSSDSAMSAVWRKDSEILYDADIENFVRYQQQAGEALEYTSVLHLFNVNFTDEGKYQCIVTNHFGSNYSQKAKLTVNGKKLCSLIVLCLIFETFFHVSFLNHLTKKIRLGLMTFQRDVLGSLLFLSLRL